MSSDDDEMLDAVDELDRVIGQIRRHDLKSARANYRVVHVFLFNSRGELLLQRLSPSHPQYAGFWGSSVAGHVRSGESYSEAARRETEEELGVRCEDLTLVRTIPFEEDAGRKFIGLFVGRHEGPFRLDPSEGDAIRFATLDEVAGSTDVTPTFRRVLDEFLARG